MNPNAKIKRELLKTYINVDFGAKTGTPEYVLIGKGIESMDVSMGANVNKTNDILGTTEIYIDKYEKTQSVEPYFARKDDKLFAALQAIADGDLKLDDLNTDVIDVKAWEAETTGSYPAVKEECVVELVSYGGDTQGYALPFNLHRTGIKTKGTFNPTTKAFTAGI